MRQTTARVSVIEDAIDFAQRALAVPTSPVDEHGVTFAVGQHVETLTELWRTGGSSMSMLVVGTRGEIASLGPTNASVIFEGDPAPYYIRMDRLKVALRVVEVSAV